MSVTKQTRVQWEEDGNVLVQENTNGTFNIVDWHMLDEDRLKRVHEALGVVLTDLAAMRQSMPEAPDPFMPTQAF
jgi:hypothetical protein